MASTRSDWKFPNSCSRGNSWSRINSLFCNKSFLSIQRARLNRSTICALRILVLVTSSSKTVYFHQVKRSLKRKHGFTEFKMLPIPYKVSPKIQFPDFCVSFKKKNNIGEILDVSDLNLLHAGLGLSAEEIVRVQTIRKGLVARRSGWVYFGCAIQYWCIFQHLTLLRILILRMRDWQFWYWILIIDDL